MEKYDIPAPKAHLRDSEIPGSNPFLLVLLAREGYFWDPFKHRINTLVPISISKPTAVFARTPVFGGSILKYRHLKESEKVVNETILEEVVAGQEICILSFSDGETYRSLPYARPFKVIVSCTGGGWETSTVGCIAPAKDVSTEQQNSVDNIIRKTFDGLKKEGKSSTCPLTDI